MTTKTNYTDKMLLTVRNYFTDDEWNAIEEAMGDYQDYGDNAAELASQIEDKIYSYPLFFYHFHVEK